MANGESLTSNTNPEPRDDEILDNSAETSRATNQPRGETTNNVVIDEKRHEQADDNNISTFEELRNVDISNLNHQQLLEYRARLEEEHRRLSSSIAERRERLGLPPQESTVESTPSSSTSTSSAPAAAPTASATPTATTAPTASATPTSSAPTAPLPVAPPSTPPTSPASTESTPTSVTSGESTSDAPNTSSERYQATAEKVKKPGGIKRTAGRIAKAAVPLVLAGIIASSSAINMAGNINQANQDQDTTVKHTAIQEDQEAERQVFDQIFDYSEWSDFEHKNGINNYGYDYTDLHGNDSETRSATIEMAGKSPQALGSYAYEYFTPQEKADLGIDNMTATEIQQAIKDADNPNSVALHNKVLDKWQEIMNSGDTFLTFIEADGIEYSYYMYGGDDNGDGSYTPDEVHLGYDQVERHGSKQFKIARYIDGKLVVFDAAINEDCGFQPTKATAPQGVVQISTINHNTPTPDSDTGSEDTGSEGTGSEDTGSEGTGSEDTGLEDTGEEDTGSEDTGEEGTGLEDTGEEDTGLEDTGEEDTGSEDTGEEDTGLEDTGEEDTGSEDTGEEGTGSEGTGEEGTGSEDTGEEGTGSEDTGEEGTSEWGKSGDPHGGDDVTPSDQVDPGSEVSQEVNDATNDGNQGYVDDNQATPGSASENNGVDDSGFAEIIADDADTDGGNLSGGEEQGGDTTNGDNAYQDQETIEQGQAVDAGGNAAQEEAQTSGGEGGTGAAPGGDNNSDAAEEAAVEKGDF